MRVDIIIPTWNRPESLTKTVQTILSGTYKNTTIFIVIDGNADLISLTCRWPVAILFNKKRRDWVYSINRALLFAKGDGVIYASDDLEFEPTCIEIAVRRMLLKAPDLDGLVTIKQDVRGCSTAFGLLGRKFIDRFPGRQVLCPDFIHYGSDGEIGRFARSIGRLYICDEAKVKHRRPHDETFHLAKPVEQRDIGLLRKRKEMGLLWGHSFERLT